MRQTIVAAALVAVAGCAAHRFIPPTGVATPAPGAEAVWRAATARCRSVQVYQAALGISGRINNHRIPGLASAVLNVAVTADGRIGMEALVSSQPMFRLGGTADQAQLLLIHEQRFVQAPADAIVEALVGVAMGPQRFMRVLTGCLLGPAEIDRAEQVTSVLRLTAGDTTVFLEPRDTSWQLRAGVFPGAEVEYKTMLQGLPRELIVRSAGDRPAALLNIKVRDSAINPVLPDAAFVVRIPEGVRPMSLDELREARF